MEFVMLWWDELDDLAALVRHVTREVMAEVMTLPRRPAWSSAIEQLLRLPA
jgi:hypothetical protein